MGIFLSPSQRLFQKIIEGLEGKINGQALGAVLWHSFCWSDWPDAQYQQSIKTFLTLELSKYSKSGGTFSSGDQVAVAVFFKRAARLPPARGRPARLKKTCYHSCDTT